MSPEELRELELEKALVVQITLPTYTAQVESRTRMDEVRPS